MNRLFLSTIQRFVQSVLYRKLNATEFWAMTVATRVGISALRRKYYQDVSMEPFWSTDAYSMEVAITDESILSNSESRSKKFRVLQKVLDEELTDKQCLAARAFLCAFATDEIVEQLNMNRKPTFSQWAR